MILLKYLKYDEVENEFFYIDNERDRDRIKCLDLSTSSEWLSDKLPEPFFDFDQGGNIRKSEEISTFLDIAVVFSGFQGEIFDARNQCYFSAVDFLSEYAGESFNLHAVPAG